MASPLIQYAKLVSLASMGGYNETPKMSQLSGSFLLSACLVMRQKWLWQNPIAPIDTNEYQNIIEMIEQTEYELMTGQAIGSIVPSVSDLSGYDSYILLDGTLLDGTLYPELLAVVPSAWLSGTDIQLPNMVRKGLFGENGDVGDIIGENDVTLTIAEIPSHTHTQDPHSHSEIIPAVTPALGGEIPATASLVVATPSTTGLATATNQNTGGDESHNNIQESLTVYWYIKVR